MPFYTSNSEQDEIIKESSRRRTFAIISHPDAGKTTLTEKLLLYGGALEIAGAITAKNKQRETASDWMELEKKRGISVSSTVLKFDYHGFHMNLLDTPGHKDFSEDTYRVLMAADSVIMVIDASKGIESQTMKLFEICRWRQIPIISFMNKIDRPAKSPFELIDELEKKLHMDTYPVNWPLGNGLNFKGIYDRLRKEVHLFERVPGGMYKSPVSVRNFSDPLIKNSFLKQNFSEISEQLAILDVIHEGYDLTSILRGKSTPVFFGSASNNFGVELLLQNFINFASGPAPRLSKQGLIPLNYPHFSSFVFKVQTNMNPLHRDRVVFARVCSGKFCREMKIYHERSGRNIRLSDSYTLFGRNRELVGEAYPGDILGFVTKHDFRVGDTITTAPGIVYEEIRRFAPECFAFLHPCSQAKIKAFRKGLRHLLAEDIVQFFFRAESSHSTPLLGAVGPLQYDVLQYRLKEEYKSDTRLEMMPWKVLRWAGPDLSLDVLKKSLPFDAVLAKDDMKRNVILFESDWSFTHFSENNPSIKLFNSPGIT